MQCDAECIQLVRQTNYFCFGNMVLTNSFLLIFPMAFWEHGLDQLFLIDLPHGIAWNFVCELQELWHLVRR